MNLTILIANMSKNPVKINRLFDSIESKYFF